MGFSFRFETVESREQRDSLFVFARENNLGYDPKKYQNWLDRSEPELSCRYKTAIIAVSNGKIVANGIAQPHKQIKNMYEIKQVRVHPEFQFRFFGSFIVKQFEVMAKNSGYYGVLGDLRVEKKSALSLMSGLGYQPLMIFPLSENDKPDIIMAKFFDSRGLEGTICTLPKIFS